MICLYILTRTQRYEVLHTYEKNLEIHFTSVHLFTIPNQ